ncbi:MAG: hypothetical protein KF781_08330 [Chitinophagaceae bacterium]|nr:hypothetical protein [Chitinophagaceae bacterium]MCW5905763.1 hypothetical protein [Chitinophagaceae bacterium]
MKKISICLFLVAVAVVLTSSLNGVNYSFVPPQGHTGATGDYCVSCHNSFGLNSGGGSVSIAGLPTGSYEAGQQYPFSLTISHSVANRTRWGFSIKAINSNGQEVGTFSSTNPNAAPNGEELSHQGAVITSPQASYTYDNLRWTAPASPSSADENVTFYYAGNAANASFDPLGDYIYSNISAIALPVTLKEFKAQVKGNTVLLAWETITQQNSKYFEIEKSDNGQTFYNIGKVNVTRSATASQYSYTDENPSYFGKPVYYRLKVIDDDGSFAYSKIINVQLKANSIYVDKVYPTLLFKGNSLNAEIISPKKQNISIQLFDISGRELQRFNMSVNEGKNKITVQPNVSISKGWLFARFTASGFQQTISLTVQ